MKYQLLLGLVVVTMMSFGCGDAAPKTEGEGADASDNSTASTEINFDEMAEGFCACMRPMFEFQQKVFQLAEEGKEDEIEAFREQAMQVQQDGESCIAALEAKYGVVEGAENEAKATEALKKACPDIMDLMGAAAEGYEE
ncbi:MAG: hypothetical protein R2825_01590 [Saprospiraceae bacterium]